MSVRPGQFIHLPLPWGPQIPECCVFMCLQPTPCLFVTPPVHASPCLSPSVPPPPPHVLLPLTETLASAKEENVEIHQTLDQTLLELNNL